ncbi:hypothetical protein CTI12_AA357300 [Artemisia annua]|uniref:Kinesin motor domain-containing protein n=1 Tax=Artemisia annua TaxID=35608 RepID=A0A2U1MPH4_ARTAN|nr:hypothetical protein CTI12_AA357300 [Artemisia annua]
MTTLLLISDYVNNVKDLEEFDKLFLKNRTIGATALNEESSRSHSILTVHVCGEDLEKHLVLCGNLTLVDLAGSERLDKSEADGVRLVETQHINKSLLALGDVIVALGQDSQHVPYKNSPLTKVLEKSLGATSKVLMFLQLSPEVESFSETISSLRFAERVSGVVVYGGGTMGAALGSLRTKVSDFLESLSETLFGLEEVWYFDKDHFVRYVKKKADIVRWYPDTNVAEPTIGVPMPHFSTQGGNFPNCSTLAS